MRTSSRQWIAPALAGLIALVLSLSFVRTGAWSVFDEYTHFDYVVKIAEDGHLPKVNDVLGQTALHEAVCAKAPGFGVLSAACDADAVDPSLTPYRGQSTATGYLPTYYAVTALGTRIVEALPGNASWLTSARVVGSVYLAIAAMLIVGIARRLGASDALAVSAGVLAAAMPMTLLQFSTVNNDALAVVFSLAAVYSFLRMSASTPARRSIVAFGFALLGMLVKEIAVIGVVAVTVLSLRDVLQGARSRGSGVARVVASAFLAVFIPWVLRSLAYPQVVGVIPDNGLQNQAIVNAQGTPPINLVAGNALQASVTALQAPDGVLAGVWFAVAAQLLMLVAIGMCIAMVLRANRRSQLLTTHRLLSVVVVVMIPVFTIGFLAFLRVTGLPPFFQPRYLLPTVLLAVPIAFAWIRPAWGRAMLVIALVFAGIVGFALATAPQWMG